MSAGGGRPVGPYSPVVEAGTWIITSGQVGAVPGADGSPRIVPGGFDAELRQALSNLAGVLADGGAGLAQVVKATVYLTDIGDYAAMNRIWIEAFSAPRPARSAVAVAALPLGARVEVEAWAFRRPPAQAPSTTDSSADTPSATPSATRDAPPDHPG